MKSSGPCARMPLVKAEAGQQSLMTTFCCKPNCLPTLNPTLIPHTGKVRLISPFSNAASRRGEVIPGFLSHYPTLVQGVGERTCEKKRNM